MSSKRDAEQAFGRSPKPPPAKKSKTSTHKQPSAGHSKTQTGASQSSRNHVRSSAADQQPPASVELPQVDKFSTKKRSRSRRRHEEQHDNQLQAEEPAVLSEVQEEPEPSVVFKTDAEPQDQPQSQAVVKIESEEKPEKSRRSRRKQKPQFDKTKSHIESVLAEVEQRGEDDQTETTLVERRPPRKNSKEHDTSKKKRKQKQADDASWSISSPVGGVFIDHDPVLTSDEQHLVLATKNDIQIYATKTSLLIRTIHVTTTSEITSYALLPEEHHIIVGLADSNLVKFDWTTGRKVWTTSHSGRITFVLPTSATAASDGYLLVSKTKDGSHNLSSLAVDVAGKHLGKRHMLGQKHILPYICSNPDLGVAVVCSKDTIFLGRLGDEDFQWQQINVSGGKIICFDAQILPPPAKSSQPMINVALGLQSGEIHMYNDILNKSGRDLHARRLHWHRAASRTVKFSPDSNYLVSGGEETVLVIWQLDTNQKQTLPHLTTAILSASISQRGSAYALRLADNSVMVLSTSDLKPFASISSLAFATSTAPYLPDLAVPAVLHPQHSDRLLMAYSLQSLNPGLRATEKTANMLQTYDISAQLQLNRQALARNLVSIVNIGPGGQPLHEPEVTHLDISHDGDWLVTVDQWTPPAADMNELYLRKGEQGNRKLLSECFLRFWSNNGATESWQLNTRIDDPASGGKDILAIVSSPFRQQVAIADGNYHVKFYSPKARVRNGVPVTAEGKQLYTWTCDHDISLQEAAQLSKPKSASLTFSADGSIIAACWGTASTNSCIHLIETKTATTIASLPDIMSNGKPNLAFCGKYMLALSTRFLVYDTITAQTTFSVDIDETFNIGKSRMAVNKRSGTVAVAVSSRDVQKPSQLLLLDVSTQKIVLEKAVEGQVRILLAEPDRGGFSIVNGEGQSLKVSAPGSESTVLVAHQQIAEKEIVRSSIENVFGAGRKQIEVVAAGDQPLEASLEASLENVFSIETSARAPGAADLFSSVARLVSGAAA